MKSNIYNLYNRLLIYIYIIWNNYYSWIIIIIVWLFFYLIGMLTVERLYRFFLVLIFILVYSSLIQRFNIFVNHYVFWKVEEDVDNGNDGNIYKWLCIFLQLNLYKNVILYILLQVDYIACDILIFINKRFFGNLWAYRFFNILVKHVTLLVGIHIILYKFYHILKIWATSNPYEIIIKRMYGLIFSILIFSNILYVLKSFIIAYPLLGPYCIIFVIGILSEISFTSNLLNLYWQPYYIYQERAECTVIGIVTLALFDNYKRKKLIDDITLIMNFNYLYFDALLIDRDICKDNELKLDDLLKYERLQALCFYSHFYFLEHPHVFSISFYTHLLSLNNNSLSYYYYFDLYMDQIKNEFNVNDIIKVECLKNLYTKSLRLLIYLIWDMEYYLDNTFNPIDNKSLSVSIYNYTFGNPIHKIKLIPYKKFKDLNSLNVLLPFILKKKGNEIEFFNINLNYSFYEKVFYILNSNNNFLTHRYYNNKTFEEKVESYKEVWESEESEDGLESFIDDIIESPPSQRDSFYMNNQINIFMNEWFIQRDNDLKASNLKRLKDVEDEMQIFMSHEI